MEVPADPRSLQGAGWEDDGEKKIHILVSEWTRCFFFLVKDRVILGPGGGGVASGLNRNKAASQRGLLSFHTALKVSQEHITMQAQVWDERAAQSLWRVSGEVRGARGKGSQEVVVDAAPAGPRKSASPTWSPQVGVEQKTRWMMTLQFVSFLLKDWGRMCFFHPIQMFIPGFFPNDCVKKVVFFDKLVNRWVTLLLHSSK